MPSKQQHRENIKLRKEKTKKLKELLEKKQKFDEGVELVYSEDYYSSLTFSVSKKNKTLEVLYHAGYESDGFNLDSEGIDELIDFLKRARKKLIEVK